MLIINPTSTCDVCLEGYSSDDRQPHAIPCGHVFCNACLEALLHTACPLCRCRFHPSDIRRLHIDGGSSPGPTPAEDETPTVLPPGSTAEVRALLDTAKTYLRNGAPAAQFRELAHKCSFWMRHNPPEKHGDMYLLTKLLLNTAEWYAKLHEAQAQVRRSDRELESIRTQMATELQEAEHKYQELFRLHENERAAADSKFEELLRTQRDEKETALAVEKSLRDHHEKLDREWRDRYDRLSYLASDNRRPRGCTCTDDNCANNTPNKGELVPLAPMTADNLAIMVPDPVVTVSETTAVAQVNAEDTSIPTNDLRAPIWDRTPGPNQMIYFLSPLPLSDNITPITSTIPTAPLPKDNDSNSRMPPGFVPYQSPIVEPTPVRPPAREPSGLSISRPTTLNDEPTLSRSLPSQGPDIMMRSPLSSPTIRPASTASTATQRQSTPSHRDNHPSTLLSRLSVPARHDSPSSENIDEGERHRALQLQELLESPVVPPRLPHFITNNVRTEFPFQPPTRTGSSSSSRHSHTQSADAVQIASSLGRSHAHPSLTRSSSSLIETATSSSYSRQVHPPMVSQQTLDIQNPSSSSHLHSYFHPPMLSPSSGVPSNSSTRSHPGLQRPESHRKMSTASSAAQAIEREQKERRKAEREKAEREKAEREKEENEQERLSKEREEREREAERERERDGARTHQKQQRSHGVVGGAASSSLRDTTNAVYGPSQQQHHRHAHSSIITGGIGNGKGKVGVNAAAPASMGYV